MHGTLPPDRCERPWRQRRRDGWSLLQDVCPCNAAPCRAPAQAAAPRTWCPRTGNRRSGTAQELPHVVVPARTPSCECCCSSCQQRASPRLRCRWGAPPPSWSQVWAACAHAPALKHPGVPCMSAATAGVGTRTSWCCPRAWASQWAGPRPSSGSWHRWEGRGGGGVQSAARVPASAPHPRRQSAPPTLAASGSGGSASPPPCCGGLPAADGG